MKQTPSLRDAQSSMRAGAISRDGYLGDDPRGLAEILEADDARVQRLGLTHAAIAARMRALRDAGADALGVTVRTPPHFEVTVEGYPGKLPCPFGHRGIRKINTQVRNIARGTEIGYSDMSIHLIEAHGFYEGHGSPFRLEPADLAATLEIVPEA